MAEWTNASLGMYIDDGVILACGNSWRKVEKAMKTGYTTCLDWLRRAGLNVEPAKTELLFFRKWGDKSNPSHSILLPLLAPNKTYKVTAANTLRYLGFFFDISLSWAHHVNVMCC
jgi:hypothetical protein